MVGVLDLHVTGRLLAVERAIVAARSWVAVTFGCAVIAVAVIAVLLAVRVMGRDRAGIPRDAAAKPAHPDTDGDGHPVTWQPLDGGLSRLEAELGDVGIVMADDVAALRRTFGDRLSSFDDETLAAAFSGHNEVVYMARELGWSNPQIRQDLIDVLSQELNVTLN